MFFLFSWAQFIGMSGLEEILFENRNKDYGAYQLRKKANKYSIIGLLLSIGIITIISITLYIILNAEVFFPTHYPENISIESMQMSDLHDFLFPEPPKASEKASEELPKPEIVDSTFEEKKKEEALKKSSSNSDTITKKGADTPEDGKGSNLLGDSLYKRVDKWPQFIGGEKEFAKFLRKNLAETSNKLKTRARVIVRFRVTRTGDVQDVSILSGVNPDVDKEVIRVIGMSPRWNPALQSDHPIPAWCTLPINL